MKVLVLADGHLHGGPETEEAKALVKVAQIATERQVDLVVYAGDVFESKSTPIQRLVFRDWLKSLKCPVVLLRGNHDEANDLKIFEDDYVYVFEQPGSVRIPSRDGEILELHAIPHFNAGALALRENSLDDLGETGTGLFERIIDGAFQQVRTYEGPSLVTFHAVISGASLDNGYIPKENGIHLNLARLASIGCPVVGGHYHSMQNVAAEIGGQVWYPGSLTRQTFGEADGDKGVLLFTWNGHTWQEPEFISLQPTPMVLIDTEWVDGRFAFFDAPTPGQYAGCRVRFRYTVPQHEIAAAKAAERDIERYFTDAQVQALKIESQPVLSVAIRNEEIVRAETVEECFAVWARSKGEDETRISHALSLLESLLGGAEVETQTSAATTFSLFNQKEVTHAF